MTGSILTTALSVADLEEGADTYLVSPDVIPGWAAAYADVALTRLVHGPATMIDSLDAQGRAMSRRGVPVPPFA